VANWAATTTFPHPLQPRGSTEIPHTRSAIERTSAQSIACSTEKGYAFAEFLGIFSKPPATEIRDYVEVPDTQQPPKLNYGDGENRILGIQKINLLYPGRLSVANIALWKVGSKPFDKNNQPEPMTPALREDLRLGKKYVVIYANGTFDDDLGKHWFNYCVWLDLAEVPQVYASRPCVDYNATGDFKP
jgi:hypothetical protein